MAMHDLGHRFVEMIQHNADVRDDWISIRPTTKKKSIIAQKKTKEHSALPKLLFLEEQGKHWR